MRYPGKNGRLIYFEALLTAGVFCLFPDMNRGELLAACLAVVLAVNAALWFWARRRKE